jgi:hypothetical protein
VSRGGGVEAVVIRLRRAVVERKIRRPVQADAARGEEERNSRRRRRRCEAIILAVREDTFVPPFGLSVGAPRRRGLTMERKFGVGGERGGRSSLQQKAVQTCDRKLEYDSYRREV